MIPGRRWLAARSYRIGPWMLVPAGLAIGFLTGIVVSTGPITVPLFSAYGLVGTRQPGRRERGVDALVHPQHLVDLAGVGQRLSLPRDLRAVVNVVDNQHVARDREAAVSADALEEAGGQRVAPRPLEDIDDEVDGGRHRGSPTCR